MTCYSEGEASLRTTIESLARTNYPDHKKFLFVIADGEITGSGNQKSTPDICRDMMVLDSRFPSSPAPQGYIAIGVGSKQLNMAKVYAGHFLIDNHRVPMILDREMWNARRTRPSKSGQSRKTRLAGHFDEFLLRVAYNDRMTPLDYDIFTKTRALMGITPDFFEAVLMVDADTQVEPDSLRLLTNALQNDPTIMGLCGETRISNKVQSWVTSIQGMCCFDLSQN